MVISRDDDRPSLDSDRSSDTTSFSGSNERAIPSTETSSSRSSSEKNSDGVPGRDSSANDNYEVGFLESTKAVLPWTEAGTKATYAEERLGGLKDFKEELDQALLIRKMVDKGMHDRALERLMASTEGQMYHDFHKHRYVMEQSGEWSFIPPSVRRRWKIADKRTDAVERLRKYMAMRRDHFLRIRGLCGQIRSAEMSSTNQIVTVMPEDLIDKNILAIRWGKRNPTPHGTFSKTKLCHWRVVNLKSGACMCINPRMKHPNRFFRDEFGALLHDTLATCGWHASHCVSGVHGDDPVPISTANEGALCNECLVQIVKGPLKNIAAFDAPGVRLVDTKDCNYVKNKWFMKRPGGLRKTAVRPRHPNAPPGLPPAGLRSSASFITPPPLPPVFTMDNLRRQRELVKWQLRKKRVGAASAKTVQRVFRGFRARREIAKLALEHPERVRKRVESAIVIQSLMRRFLARVLVCQINFFRGTNATNIQRVVRGIQARELLRQQRAQAILQRWMLVVIAKAFVKCIREAERIRSEMRRKNAGALSVQRAWWGRKRRKGATMLRIVKLRREGAAIIAQKAWRCYHARVELNRCRAFSKELAKEAIAVQSAFRMAIARWRIKRTRQEYDVAVRRIQSMVRGMLARALARREQALVNKKKNAAASVAPLVSDGLESLPGEEHFTKKFDRERVGTCTKDGFKLGLESFCRSVGYTLQRKEAKAILRHFFDGDVYCSWHSFLKAYHKAAKAGNIICTRHCRLLCSVCVRHGKCEKAGCSCIKARAKRSKPLGFQMCECGHPFEVHAIRTNSVNSEDGTSTSTPGLNRVVSSKKLNSILGRDVMLSENDRPVHVQGCSFSSALASTDTNSKNGSMASSRSGNHHRSRRLPYQQRHSDRIATSGLMGECPETEEKSTSMRSRHALSATSSLKREGATKLLPDEMKGLPTMREAREEGYKRRNLLWAGWREQAERAALAEVKIVTQHWNAAEYFSKNDLATSGALADERIRLAPMQTKERLHRGFAISDVIPFVKAGTLKVTKDPVGLYLAVIKALSDEKHDMMKDDRRFTDYVSRHAAFLERHWCKLVRDIRNGSLDPHLPISDDKRARVKAMMIPKKKRAKDLDDMLRVLGFHARKSDGRGTDPRDVRSTHRRRGPTTKAEGEARPRDDEFTLEEREESMAKRVEASRKRRPETDRALCGGSSQPGKLYSSGLKHRKTVTRGELESDARLPRFRAESRARSRIVGALPVLPTKPQQTAQMAYELSTAASAVTEGVAAAPSGRLIRKHVCLHPGCGKVFHLKVTAEAHQKKEHRLRRKLVAPAPFTDQFMASAWPKDWVPWASDVSSRSLTDSSSDYISASATTILTRRN